MKSIFDGVGHKVSALTTKSYSTSFSLAIRLLDQDLRRAIYDIYGFVRFADEIVDTFHDFDKKSLLEDFKLDTIKALDARISLNPILNSFQKTVHEYHIDLELIDTFLKSMEMDLDKKNYDQSQYEEYILGSAEVVGLMCLKIFVYGDEDEYQRLKPAAMSLGSAFQKINFLRDIHADFVEMGRTYFPGVDMNNFDEGVKKEIEADIKKDFDDAFVGIKELPKSSRLGVYLAYVYYLALFKKIRNLPASAILENRVRIPNKRKYAIILSSYVKHSAGWI